MSVVLRLRAHMLTEAHIATLLHGLLIALSVAVGLPIVRWVSLLGAMRAGDSMRPFAIVIAPIMAMSSVMQAIMIGSWLHYRRDLAAQNAAEDAEEEQMAREEEEELRAQAQATARRRALLAPQAPRSSGDDANADVLLA